MSETFVVLVQQRPFQSNILHWYNGETIWTRFRRSTRVTAKSRPMMNLIARAPSHVSSSTSVSPVKRIYGCHDPWSSNAKEDRSGRLDKGTDLFEASDHHFHEQFMESVSSATYSKGDDDRAWSSQDWNTEATTYDRSGRPHKTSWRMVRQVRPGHEEILLNGTAQSVRNEETLRDRSGRLDDINSQEETRPQDWRQLVGSIILGKYLSLIGDVRIISVQRTNVHVFSDSVLCLWEDPSAPGI